MGNDGLWTGKVSGDGEEVTSRNKEYKSKQVLGLEGEGSRELGQDFWTR